MSDKQPTSEDGRPKLIVIRETVVESWLIDGATFLMFCFVILMSYFFNSTIMGFFGLAMVMTLIIARATGKRKIFTIAEARAELDRIEKGMQV